jgi:hypothetical protein
MNIINPVLAVVLATYSLATIAGLSTNAAPPYAAIQMEGFNAGSDRNAAIRRKMVDFMVSMGERSAKSGVAYSQGDWLELYRSVSIGTPSFTVEFLEVLRRNQNAQAELVRRQR